MNLPNHSHGARTLTAVSSFPVIAVGASAGGLEAFRTFVTGLPANSGMAFVLVQHLDPSHKSMMANLLAPHTGMPILEAQEGMRLEPNHVYLNPPGRYLALHSGVFEVSLAAPAQSPRMPFDFLLQSLAEEVGERAVCVILSGTASDGSVGARAIKAAGGLAIAQDPSEAQYDGMPRNAIATGVVDLILPLAKMWEAIEKFAGHQYIKVAPSEPAAATIREGTKKIIDLLRKKTAHDFALYKEGTIGRRIERRMAMAGIEDSNRYLELLTQDPAELQKLANDLFINVTRFFRDEDAFTLLAEKIVPELVHAQPAGRPIRIWVPGCSTGEEAYSIAILFLEEIAKAQRSIKLQIFASDIDGEAIAVAREGLFPWSIEADVSPARLTRFFAKEDQNYRVSRELRAAVVFSVHDVTADAPFSRLDLLSCRNLLIYLRPEVQQKVLSLFHFALREGGILFLGNSETVSGADGYFEPIFAPQRIFRHIGRTRPGEVELPLGRGEIVRSLLSRPRPTTPHINVSDLAQRVLLESYAPASVLANRRHQGLYYFGPIDRYLRMPTGVASQDVLAAAREGLRPAIRAVLDRFSDKPDQPIVIAGRLTRNGHSVAITVSARPVRSDDEQLVLLSFIDAPIEAAKPEVSVESPVEMSRIAQLEQELDAMGKELASAVSERETAEEELRAINEEAMSVNEEFQTTNEELETSKEELQSLNEELTALNSQLQETLEQHKATANDLENILNSADTATLFLDEKLRIRFFTPAAKSLFSVIASDVGRPLADLAQHFANGHLLADCQSVIDKLGTVTREVETANGVTYTCRILPYRTKENRIEGVVVTFADVTIRKQAEDAMSAAKLAAEGANLAKSRFLAAASHDLRQPLQTLVLLHGLLTTKLAGQEELEIAKSCDEALKAMSGMLNTLLDINQLEAGVVRPAIVDFPISDLLEKLKPEYAFHAQERGLDWRVVPCGLTVRSDPRLLEDMIRNLLSNAAKYTEKGGILLGCRRRGDKLRIEVWDTGLGIPEAQLRQIFQEFHQLDNPSRDLNRGLGLGLAIVERLATLMGHTVDVRSWPGRGSVFSIDVPVAPQEARPATRVSEPKDKANANHRGSILIVEDDPAVRGSLELYLRAEGHRTMAAADGEAAIRLVASKDMQPDIAIVDHNLPKGLTGLTLMTRLREMVGHDLPALILTGDIGTETLSEISRQGYSHLGKPAAAETLSRLVQSLLTKFVR
jgi:two-component system, chemotaxis family, CheB/CheR fusion protein